MRWVAVLEKVDDLMTWIVSRSEPENGEPVYINFATKELAFRSGSSGDEKIKTYIARHLEAYMAGEKIDPPSYVRGTGRFGTLVKKF